MVLVLNSPSILWNIICWIVKISQSLAIQHYVMITRQAIIQVVEHSPFAFRCMSEYIFFIMFTLIYAIVKTVLHAAWLPATGLLWWFKFYRNITDDSNGRSIIAIIKNPNAGYFPNSRKRHPRPYRKRFPGSKRTAALPTCFLPVDFRENEDKARYFEIRLPINPLEKWLSPYLHHIWNAHPNAEFHHNMNTIFIALWLSIGCRCFKLVYCIFATWYTNISRHGEWNKIDPRDAQIMALTTALKDSKTAVPAPDPSKNINARKERELYFEWRMSNKGSTATWKGRLHTWCPNHKKAGVFDGM